MALSKTTQNHDEIKAWAEARGGKPAEVASTEGKDGAGILRLEFPGAAHADDSNLKEISWDDFFEKFDRSRLAMVYQDETSEGEQSNFNRLIYPENASESVQQSLKEDAKKSPVKGVSKKTDSIKGVAAKKKAGSAKAAPAKKSAASAKKATAPAKKAPPSKKAAVPAKKAAAAKKSAPARKAAVAKKPAAPAKKAAAKKAPAPAKKAAAKKAVATKVAAKKSTRR